MKQIVFILILITVLVDVNAQYFQNESWSVKDDLGIATSAFTIVDNFFFADDGTFIYSWGYSSGTYHIETYWGYYKFDSISNVIKFDIIGARAQGIPDNTVRHILPDSINVLSMNEDSAVVKGFNDLNAELTYFRKITFFKKETWCYTSGDTSHYFRFYMDKNVDTVPRDCYYEYRAPERHIVSYGFCYFEQKEFRLNVSYIKDKDSVKTFEYATIFAEFEIIENNLKLIKLDRRQRFNNSDYPDFPIPINDTIEFIKK